MTITENAKKKVMEFIGDKTDQYLRVEITGQTASEFLYRFYLDDQKAAEDVEIDSGSFKTLLKKDDVDQLQEATVDWIDAVSGAGFKVENPQKPKNNLDSPIAQKIQKVLDDEINVAVSSHGGHIQLLDVVEGRAYVKMEGGCQGCSSASATLKQGVETRIKELFPEITEVIDTTDHADGKNPYFK